MKKVGVFAFLSLCGIFIAIAASSTASPPAPAPSPAAAAAITSLPVSVVNTPLPVQGTVNATITNSPLAVQGSINANITNGSLPVGGTVGVSSLPPVTLSGVSPVSLSNSSATPVFVDTWNTARAGVGATCQAFFDASGTAQCTLATIPVGQTLVIESVTCGAAVASGSPVVPIILNVEAPAIGGGGGLLSIAYRLPLTKSASITSGVPALDYYGVATPITLYASANGGTGPAPVYMSVQVGSSTANTGNASCSLSGYVVAQ
jgi:hypothetical protein